MILKRALFGTLLLFPLLMFATSDSLYSTCTGSDPCTACKNCKYCKHCAKDGGTCGVCKRQAQKAKAVLQSESSEK